MKNWILGFFLALFGAGVGVASTLAVQSYLTNEEVKIASAPKPSPKMGSFEDFFSNDPFTEMEEMRKQMMKGFMDQNNSIFDSFGSSFGNFQGVQQDVQVETKEDDKFLVYEVSGEGLDTKSINIDVVDGMVTLSGRIDKSSTTDKDGSSSSYTMSSRFQRSFSVPSEVDSENVEMEHANGKILIKFPKKREVI